MNHPEFHLRFIEGFHDEEPRRCWRVKQVAIGTNTELLLVSVDPPYSCRDYGFDADARLIIIGPKYKEGSLFPVSEWPLDVYVFLPLISGPEFRDTFQANEVKKIAFGDIYRDGDRRVMPSGPRHTNPW
jgi:hypothetical protein